MAVVVGSHDARKRSSGCLYSQNLFQHRLADLTLLLFTKKIALE